MFPAMQHVLICSTLPVLCFVGLDEPNESLGSSRHTKPKQLVEMVCILNVTVFHVCVCSVCVCVCVCVRVRVCVRVCVHTVYIYFFTLIWDLISLSTQGYSKPNESSEILTFGFSVAGSTMVHPYAREPLPPRRAHPAPLNCTPI